MKILAVCEISKVTRKRILLKRKKLLEQKANMVGKSAAAERKTGNMQQKWKGRSRGGQRKV